MSKYVVLAKRRRISCLYFFYYVIGLLFLWTIYTKLQLINLPSTQGIFFLETSEPKDGILEITARQSCAVESASRVNPDADISVYITGVKELKDWQKTSKLWMFLLSLPNVKFKFINITEFLSATPLVELVQSDRLKSANDWITWHRSDILRYAMLWTYSGTYLDFDVISLQPLSQLGENWVVLQRPIEIEPLIIAAGAINFSKNRVGYRLLSMILKDLTKNFDGQTWSDSSVGVLTRNVVQWCKGDNITGEPVQICSGLKIIGSEAFYAVQWEDYGAMFDEGSLNITMNWISKSVGVHLWNYSTKDLKINKDKKVFLNELARKYCPATYNLFELYL